MSISATGVQAIPFGPRPEPIEPIRCQCCAILLIGGPGGQGPTIWKYCRFQVVCPKCGTIHAIDSGEHGIRVSYRATRKGMELADSMHAHDTSPRLDGGGRIR